MPSRRPRLYKVKLYGKHLCCCFPRSSYDPPIPSFSSRPFVTFYVNRGPIYTHLETVLSGDRMTGQKNNENQLVNIPVVLGWIPVFVSLGTLATFSLNPVNSKATERRTLLHPVRHHQCRDQQSGPTCDFNRKRRSSLWQKSLSLHLN